jgi:hypothetical protein
MSEKKREQVYPEVPLVEYVVREHWDTGYVDTTHPSAEVARGVKHNLIVKLMRQEKMSEETASKFVSCHLLVRIDL